MGQEILYCFKCQERVTSADLDSSNALRFGHRTACKNCVPDLLAILTPQERKDLVARVQGGQDSRHSSSRGGFSAATPRRSVPSVPAPRSGHSPALLALVGGGAAALVVVLVLFLNRPEASPPPRDSRDGVVAPPPKGTPESPRDRAAREALEKARNLPASDLDAQIAAYAQALKTAEGTPYLPEAKERHAGILDMQRKSYSRELAVIEERARALVAKEEYGASVSLVEAVRGLHAGEEWKSQVEGKIELFRRMPDPVYADLKAKAQLAKERGAVNEVKAIRERILRWGLPELAKDLESRLVAVLPAAEARPWTPLFDGKSLDFLFGKGEGAWALENGALVRVKEKKASAQTKRQFSDGEFRIRFEGRKMTHAGFAFRQVLGYYGVGWNRQEWDQIGDGEHELLVVFWGNEVVATLDGKPQKILTHEKPPFQGPLQFNAYGDYFAVKSLEFREPALDDALVGHWTFDSIDNKKAPDSSPLKNDGLLVDGPVTVPGRLGNALQFDGRRAHVVVPSHPSLIMTGPFTLSAWVKPAGTERKSAGIVEKWDSAPNHTLDGYFLRLGGNGRPHLVVAEPTEGGEVSSPRPIPLDEWTFLAGVFDGSNYLIYVNGVLDRKVPGTKASKTSTNTLRIGLSGGDGGMYFAGAIDDVRVYRRALSPAEIAQLGQGK